MVLLGIGAGSKWDWGWGGMDAFGEEYGAVVESKVQGCQDGDMT